MIRPFALTEFSQNPLVAINEFRFIREAVMRKHGPFFPRGIVLVGIDINLGFEESATEEMGGSGRSNSWALREQSAKGW